MNKLEAKVQQILNGEYIDDSSDDESVDIRALNERLDEEMIKQMQEEFDEDDEKEHGGCKDCCCDHTVIKRKRDLSFEAEWIDELKTLNTNYNISTTPEDISDVNMHRLSILFNKIITKVFNVCKTKHEDYKWYQTLRDFISWHRNIEDAELNEIFNNDTDSCLSKMEMTEDDYEEMREQAFYMFVGEDCANIDEDEFDGPLDLQPQEWETIDDIICCYYYYVYHHK